LALRKAVTDSKPVATPDDSNVMLKSKDGVSEVVDPSGLPYAAIAIADGIVCCLKILLRCA